MNSLVNFNNGTELQTPGILIDYVLCKRPILCINFGEINQNDINAFMNGDYSNQYMIKDIDRYNIINIAKEFILLSKF